MDEELIIGAIYKVRARNFNVAVWTGTSFKGPSIVDGRYEFVYEWPHSEPHPLGSVFPIERISDQMCSIPYEGHNFLVAMITLDQLVYGAGQ